VTKVSQRLNNGDDAVTIGQKLRQSAAGETSSRLRRENLGVLESAQARPFPDR
jgi:hypothetical protein